MVITYSGICMWGATDVAPFLVRLVSTPIKWCVDARRMRGKK